MAMFGKRNAGLFGGGLGDLGKVSGGAATTTTPVTAGSTADLPFGTHPNLTSVQTMLTAMAMDPGPIDGAWGPRTAAALRRYVTAQGREGAELIFGRALVARAYATAAPDGGGTPLPDPDPDIPSGMLPPGRGIFSALPPEVRGIVEHPMFVPTAAGLGLIGVGLYFRKKGRKGK